MPEGPNTVLRPTGRPIQEMRPTTNPQRSAAAGGDEGFDPRQGDAVDERLTDPEQAGDDGAFDLGAQQGVLGCATVKRQGGADLAGPCQREDGEQELKPWASISAK
jgi:hypothetical protein